MSNITRGIAEQFVWEIIEIFRTCQDSKNIGMLLQLKRDVIYYGAILQKTHKKIHKKQLLMAVGTSSEESLDIILQELDKEGYLEDISDNYEQFKFNDHLFAVVLDNKSTKAGFYGPHSYYRLDQPLKGHANLGETIGEELVNTINQPESKGNYGFATQKIAHIINKIVGLSILETLPEDKRFIVLSDDVPIAQLIFCVVCHNETLPEEVFDKLFKGIHLLKRKYPNTKVLLICPSINGEQAKTINKEDDLFCMWDLSFVAFLHLLAVRLGTSEDRSFASKKFAQLFEHTKGHDYCYLECHAMTLLG